MSSHVLTRLGYRVKPSATSPTVELPAVEEQLLVPGAGLVDVDGRVDAAVGQRLAQRLSAAGIQTMFVEVSGARHKKEALYDKVASRAFAFSAEHFPKK